jgi:hypothetical protein
VPDDFLQGEELLIKHLWDAASTCQL